MTAPSASRAVVSNAVTRRSNLRALPVETEHEDAVVGAFGAAESADSWFTWLCQRYRSRLVRYASRCFTGVDGEEVAQETLIRALASLRPSTGDPWPWLRTVALNVGRDLTKAARHRRELPYGERLGPLGQPTLDPELEAIHGERDGLVHRALTALPGGQRHVLWLHEVDGANCREIAELLGGTEEGIRRQLCRGRSRLAREFRDLGGRLALPVPLAAWPRRWLLRGRRLTSPATSAASSGLSDAAVLATAAVLTVGVALLARPAGPMSPVHTGRQVHRLASRPLVMPPVRLASRSQSNTPRATSPAGGERAQALAASPVPALVPATGAVPKVRNPIPSNGTVVYAVVPTPAGTARARVVTLDHGNPTICRLPVIDCSEDH